jgi:hypothetical protein
MRAPAPSLPSHSMPPRITKESYRPRVSNRTMVGVIATSACQLQKPNSASTVVSRTGKRIIRSEAKAEKPKALAIRRGAGRHAPRTTSRVGEKLSVDIPFYRTFPQPRRAINIQPDISLATKTGHFNLLTSEARKRSCLHVARVLVSLFVYCTGLYSLCENHPNEV